MIKVTNVIKHINENKSFSIHGKFGNSSLDFAVCYDESGKVKNAGVLTHMKLPKKAEEFTEHIEYLIFFQLLMSKDFTEAKNYLRLFGVEFLGD